VDVFPRSSLPYYLSSIDFDILLIDTRAAKLPHNFYLTMTETTSHGLDTVEEADAAHSTDHSQTASKQKQEDVESTPSGAEEYKHEYPEGFRLTLILTAVVLAYLLVYLDLAIMSTATPSITSNFDSLVDIGWYGGAYQLASAAFQPLSGKIYSYFSIKASPGPMLTRVPLMGNQI
jgi:hypothetical protein